MRLRLDEGSLEFSLQIVDSSHMTRRTEQRVLRSGLGTYFIQARDEARGTNDGHQSTSTMSPKRLRTVRRMFFLIPAAAGIQDESKTYKTYKMYKTYKTYKTYNMLAHSAVVHAGRTPYRLQGRFMQYTFTRRLALCWC